MAAEGFPIEVGAVFLIVQKGLDGAMRQQVRIAPDRRGEMHVRLVGEAEVADVLRRVHRLLARAQEHRLQQMKGRPALDALDELGVVLGLRYLAAGQREAELREKGAQ